MIHKPSAFFVRTSVFLACSVFLASCSQPQAPASTSTTNPTSTLTQSQLTQPAQPVAAVTPVNQSDLTDLMINLEDHFGLKEVLIDQSGASVTVRVMAPTITGEELYTGLVQVFGYMNENLPSQIEKIDLIFTINGVDSMIVSVDRKYIDSWKSGTLTNAAFIQSFKETSLL